MQLKNLSRVTALGLLLLASYVNAGEYEADKGSLAVSLKAGTLGAGIEFDYPITPKWSLRLQANALDYDDTFDQDDIEYEGAIELSSYGALLDWHPFAGAFRISLGAYANSNKLTGFAQSSGGDIFAIGDFEYRGVAADPLTIDASVDLGNSTAGFLGFGWGNSYQSGLKFSLDLGVLFSGAPEVNLALDGSAELVNHPGVTFAVNGNSALATELQRQVAKEVANFEDDISSLEFYPVVLLGIGYRF